MNFDANKNFEAAKAAANLNDPKSMCELFDAAATKYYLDHTEKTFEELEAENFYADLPNWSANCQGTEWKSIEDCIECAEIGIDQILEEENR